MADNPIYANDANYRRKLEVLPDALRRAMLDGDWDQFAGQYFDIFEHGRHTGRRESFKIQDWWPKWISIDRGFVHPSAVYWHTITPEKKVITYREFVQPGLTARMLGEGICERNGNDKIVAIYLSPDAFGRKTSEHSDAEEMSSVFAAHGLPEAGHAQDDRVIGWQFCYSLLQNDQAVIAEECPHLIKCVPTLVRADPPHEEDIRKMEGDDPGDGWRYGLVTHLMPARKPVNDRVEERLQAAEKRNERPMTMTNRAIWAQKYQKEEEKKSFPVTRKRFRGT